MNIELLSRFGATRVLVLGDAIVDEYLSGDCSRLSPEAPVPVLRVKTLRQTLGGAANTAANITSLGGNARLIALTGEDATGERLSALCQDVGITLVPVHDGRATLRKARVVGQHQQLVRLDFEDSHPIDAATEARVMALVREHLDACDIVVLSDYAKGLLTEPICRFVISEAHALDKLVIADPRPEHRAFYRHCDYLTPNWKESRGLLGLPEEPPTGERIEETGRALVRDLDINLLLTLGPGGMAFFGRDGHEHFSVPTEAREVFDVSGAGDTVVATFALARGAGASHAEAVALANRAAGVVVGKLGTATVTPQELLGTQGDASRLVPRRELAILADALRAKGKRIVTVNGSFDLLHAGHLHILREASRQGDTLLVGLNSDASIRSYKGPDRPLIPQAQRAEMLLALRFVDYVHIFDESEPMPFLEEVRPDVHVNGAEYGEDCIEAPVVKRYGGRIHLVDRIGGLSTSQLVAQLSAVTATSRSLPDRSTVLDPW
ncbi:MAG TPA: bifunctional heptose 7-phosphate kinase/heptose 1-phosphate adenyltransferase [Vicinamibacterales bacterium]|nr:bifunctional heptose 7-phosphate kinase/heptose 1-phosphate adenyltransferase [Vicinamibacterales bacterium]